MKRGSLQLSINAIVVLILAITMLGLGLAFMRSTFGGVVSQFEEVSAEVQKDMLERLEKSPENLVLNRVEMELRPGETKELYLAIRNDLDVTETFYIDEKVNNKAPSTTDCALGQETTYCCISMSGYSCATALSLSTFPRVTLDAGSSKVLKIEISADPKADKDTYMVPIRVQNHPQQQTDPLFDKVVTINVIVR
jgi:hypothetical protein